MMEPGYNVPECYTERYYLCALSVSIFYDVSLLFSIAHKISVKIENQIKCR